MILRNLAASLSQAWERTGSGARLSVGVLVCVAVMLLGLRPVDVFGVAIPWPYASLWAAVGWARAGLSARPMLPLVILGLAQDVLLSAPLGCFVIVNLVTYGLHAGVMRLLGSERDPVAYRVLPPLTLAVGAAMVWIVASGVVTHPVRVAPIVWSYLATVAGFQILRPVFNPGMDRSLAGWRG